MQRTVRRVGARCGRTGVRPLIEVSAPHHHGNCPYNEPFHPYEWTRVYFSSHDLLLSFIVFFHSRALQTRRRTWCIWSRWPPPSAPSSSFYREQSDSPFEILLDPTFLDPDRLTSTVVPADGVFFFARRNSFSSSTSRREKFRD